MKTALPVRNLLELLPVGAQKSAGALALHGPGSEEGGGGDDQLRGGAQGHGLERKQTFLQWLEKALRTNTLL